MTKSEFIARLSAGLSGLSKLDRDERLGFYAEMIDDQIEEGLTEEEAVAQIGEIDSVIAEILKDYPLAKLVKEKIKPKRALAVWEIVLLVIGSPIWVSLLIAAGAVVLSLYVSIWAIVVSLWSVFASLVGSSIGCLLGGLIIAFSGDTFAGLATVAAGLAVLGLSIFAFYGCKYATKEIIFLTKRLIFSKKKRISNKEVA